MKYSVTLIKYKVVTVEADDEIEAKESEQVQAELNSEGWDLADATAELIP
jgi:hypothetical protein